MIGLGSMSLLRPWWLIAIPLVVAVVCLSVRQTGALGGWTRAIEPKLLAALIARGAVIPGKGRRSFACAFVAGLSAIALAGPAVQRANSDTYRNLDATVIAVDLSRSVAVGGHMAEALTAARAVVEAKGSRQVALVVYAGDAYSASSFTTDHEALETTIFALDESTVPDPGSRPSRALSLARQMLEEANIVRGEVVLISDGGGVDRSAFDQARAIASAGYSLETLFVPAKTAMPAGAPEPDRGSLDALAASVNGIAADVLDFGPVLDRIASRPAARLGRADFAVLAWEDFGRFLIAAALIPALFLFRRTS